MKEKRLTIAEIVWFKELNYYATKYGLNTTGDFEDYRERYECGYTPSEVLIEEISNCG